MARGSLRIYLGAAPGVGKTYAMLSEGARRRSRGADVVVGIVETHGRSQTAAQIGELEVVTRRTVQYRGATLQEMDLDAILRRQPKVVLVDEYAHTNAPGSTYEKRWQDVEALLDAGIDVISTVNIQHLESLNDVVYRITGVQQRETVPDAMVRRADQIELVDMSPEALRKRMAHGNIYPAEKVDAALTNYFRPGNLGALRELALLWLADRVEESLAGYLVTHGIADTWETRERIVVALSGMANDERVVRRAARLAARNRGELIGVHVVADDGLAARDDSALERQRRLVTELGGRCYEAVGDDPAETLARFARREKATQVVLGSSRPSRWAELMRGSTVARVTRLLGDIDVHVIASERDTVHGASIRPTFGVDRRRMSGALLLLVVGLPLLTGALMPLRGQANLSTLLLIQLCLVIGVAAVGGTLIAVLAAVASSLVTNWFFVPPYGTLTIAHPENVVALSVFVVVGVAVGLLVDVVIRRSADARRSRLEAEALARSATSLAAEPDPIPALLDHVRATVGVDGVRLRREASLTGAPPAVVAEVGELGEVPSFTTQAVTASGVAVTMETFGVAPPPRSHALLATFAGQLGVALDSRNLAEQARSAAELAEVDAVRTGLLRAVSHDLRTPLASIKAMVSGVLEPGVQFSSEQLHEALTTVDEEADRLNRLVENLLDASRLQIGALAVHLETVDLAEVVRRAIDSLGPVAGAVEVRLDRQADVVWADPALLERCVANLAANAIRYAPAGTPVSVSSSLADERVALRVSDHGPGIDPADRGRVVAPFQRLGDAPGSTGVGLGLSISQGFITAMNGQLVLGDTPGGGLTVTMILPAPEAMPV